MTNLVARVDRSMDEWLYISIFRRRVISKIAFDFRVGAYFRVTQKKRLQNRWRNADCSISFAKINSVATKFDGISSGTVSDILRPDKLRQNSLSLASLIRFSIPSRPVCNCDSFWKLKFLQLKHRQWSLNGGNWIPSIFYIFTLLQFTAENWKFEPLFFLFFFFFNYSLTQLLRAISDDSETGKNGTSP